MDTYEAFNTIRISLLNSQIPLAIERAEKALAALAELERAAAEPLFILTTGAIDSGGEQDDWDIECDSSRRLDSFCAAHPGSTVKLYVAPPAPVAEIRDAARADARIAELETAMKRQAAAVKMIDMSNVARAETMMQHAHVLHDQSNTAALESERAANAIMTARIAELEKEVERWRAEVAMLCGYDSTAEMDAATGVRGAG